MNLNNIRPKNQTEDLLLSITNNCETLIEQIHRKAEDTLEFNMTKPRETFPFNPPVEVKENWMIGLTSPEVYNTIFNITDENNKFELYKIPDEKAGGVSYEKVGDEVERDLDISVTTDTDLQDDIIGPINIEECRNQVTKRLKDDKYLHILQICNSSFFSRFSKLSQNRSLLG